MSLHSANDADPFVGLRATLADLVTGLSRTVPVETNGIEERAETTLADAEQRLFNGVDAARDHRARVERALERAWEIPFGWLDISAAWVQTLNQELAAPDRAATVPESIARAHGETAARAVSVGHEVLALLRAGFPRGAHARWRTLYELSVVSEVLALGGRWTAVRYLKHREVTLARELDQWFPSRTEADVARSDARYRELIRRHGKAFASPYGWAAPVSKRKLNRPTPTFRDLRLLAHNTERFNTHFQTAHTDVHGGSLGAVLLRNGQGQLHPGATASNELGVIAAGSIACLTEVGLSYCRAYAKYNASDRWVLSASFLGAEIQAVGLRDALTLPTTSALTADLFTG